MTETISIDCLTNFGAKWLNSIMIKWWNIIMKMIEQNAYGSAIIFEIWGELNILFLIVHVEKKPGK